MRKYKIIIVTLIIATMLCYNPSKSIAGALRGMVLATASWAMAAANGIYQPITAEIGSMASSIAIHGAAAGLALWYAIKPPATVGRDAVKASGDIIKAGQVTWVDLDGIPSAANTRARVSAANVNFGLSYDKYMAYLKPTVNDPLLDAKYPVLRAALKRTGTFAPLIKTTLNGSTVSALTTNCGTITVSTTSNYNALWPGQCGAVGIPAGKSKVNGNCPSTEGENMQLQVCDGSDLGAIYATYRPSNSPPPRDVNRDEAQKELGQSSVPVTSSPLNSRVQAETDKLYQDPQLAPSIQTQEPDESGTPADIPPHATNQDVKDWNDWHGSGTGFKNLSSAIGNSGGQFSTPFGSSSAGGGATNGNGTGGSSPTITNPITSSTNFGQDTPQESSSTASNVYDATVVAPESKSLTSILDKFYNAAPITSILNAFQISISDSNCSMFLFKNVDGSDVNASICDYDQQFSAVGVILLAFAHLSALFIIFRKQELA